MGSNDMNHLGHLETVALADVNMLHYKEGTYKGSWKAAGGRSAWFMARRNLDRLITMMKPKEFPDWVQTPDNVLHTLAALRDWAHYGQKVTPLPGSIEATMLICSMLADRYTAEDIFMKIAEKPKGEDGTVLAIIRDARRYFMLVEAEMIAEGVIEPEILPGQYYERPSTDAYQMIADETGRSREEVKRMIHELFYPVQGFARQTITESVEIAVPAASPASSEPGPAVGELVPCTETELLAISGGLRPNMAPRGGSYAAEQAARHGAGEEQNHAKTPALVPWQIDRAHYEALVIRVGQELAEAFYSRRAADVWQAEPVVDSNTCPRELSSIYEMRQDPNVGNVWVVKRHAVPAELETNYPKLQLEMNTFEWETSPEQYRFMYKYDDSDQKWKLMATFSAWGREVG